MAKSSQEKLGNSSPIDHLQSAEAMLARHITSTQKDLAQVKSLMDDAIDGLVDSFISLEASVRIEQNLVLLLSSEVQNKQDELNPFRERQLLAKKLLADTANDLKTLTASADKHNPELAELSKNIAKNVARIMDENTENTRLVANEMQKTTEQIEHDVQTAVRSLQFQDTTTQLITQCGERQQIMMEVMQALVAVRIAESESSENHAEKLRALERKLQDVSATRMKEFNVDSGSVELF